MNGLTEHDVRQANACLECGRCTGVCPVSESHQFSPRRIISRLVAGGEPDAASDDTLWSCLTCKRCEQVCPVDIPYAAFNRKLRASYRKVKEPAACVHGGVFLEIMRLMQRPGLNQKRLGWLTDELKVKREKGDVLLYTGCSPYFAAYFGNETAEQLTASMRGAVRLLNAVGIEPVLLENEKCCGHDLLLRGDTEGFAIMKKQVVKQVEATGAHTVLFNCPECLSTFKEDYPPMKPALMHLSQFLAPKAETLSLKPNGGAVTIQDPCRLGRYRDVYDEPRTLLGQVPDMEIREMEHARERAICCGSTAWTGCNAGTRDVQARRLKEAEATGADTLITACPKCQIHLRCAREGEEQPAGPIPADIWAYLASRLET